MTAEVAEVEAGRRVRRGLKAHRESKEVSVLKGRQEHKAAPEHKARQVHKGLLGHRAQLALKAQRVRKGFRALSALKVALAPRVFRGLRDPKEPPERRAALEPKGRKVQAIRPPPQHLSGLEQAPSHSPRRPPSERPSSG